MHRVATLALLLLCAISSSGMFMFPQTTNVPIGRLFMNLQQRLNRNTNDFETVYHLARLHALAYASNQAIVSINESDGDPELGYPGNDVGIPNGVIKSQRTNAVGIAHLTNALVLYERATDLLKHSTNASKAWMVLPLELGRAWCLDQLGRRDDALKAYRHTLSIAWEEEITGKFNFRDWVAEGWSDIKSGRNPIHSHSRGSLGPGLSYSEETIKYMLALLDPVKDASEIEDLKRRQKQVKNTPRYITPILVPLQSADFSELIDLNAKVAFDLDGSGLQRKWCWITPKAAWLVYTGNGNTNITSALEMFGNVTFWIFWENGYDALSALDENGDGVLRGSEVRGLSLWHDANSNGICEPGEVKPLSDYGITAISCTNALTSQGTPWNANGITLTDGTTRPTYDWIVPSR